MRLSIKHSPYFKVPLPTQQSASSMLFHITWKQHPVPVQAQNTLQKDFSKVCDEASSLFTHADYFIWFACTLAIWEMIFTAWDIQRVNSSCIFIRQVNAWNGNEFRRKHEWCVWTCMCKRSKQKKKQNRATQWMLRSIIWAPHMVFSHYRQKTKQKTKQTQPYTTVIFNWSLSWGMSGDVL